jgi:tRNA-splicing ligase RtcB
MPISKIITTGKVPVKIFTDDIEPEAWQQLVNISQLPFIHSHVAAMPDVHMGIGAAVGAVIPTTGAIIPAAVGVDIGCGMNAVRLSLKAGQLPDNLRGIRSAIEAAVPVGFSMHKSDVVKSATLQQLSTGLEKILAKHKKLVKTENKPYKTWARQLGTLGGGNHFIELCLDESNNVWIMLHSGSRGIGNQIGRYFIELAKQDMQRLHVNLPDRDLAYLTEGTDYFDDYVEAVHWAQDYAMINRREMMRLIIDVLKTRLPAFEAETEAINCHHNYVAVEQHYGATVYVTRKGAIKADAGDMGIIPGSMGACSYIVRGKGNPSAFNSCAHGAGRRMSRTQAKRQFNLRDMEKQTEGVECRKDKGVIDEIPGAYKDINQVMQNQADLVDIVHTLKQVICIKG